MSLQHCRCVLAGRRRPASGARAPAARGAVAVAAVIALILLQLIVVGIVIAGARDHDLGGQRAQAARAFYSAEAGMNMSLAELYNNVDIDGDGVIGGISANSAWADDPVIGNARFTVEAMSAVSGRKFGAQGRGGPALSRCEFTIQDANISVEGFQGYAPGTALNNVGGWRLWDNNPAVVAYTTNTLARNGGLSCDILAPSDVVHIYTPTSGRWLYTAWQYIPSSTTGTDTYFILMNTYNANGAKYWSTQVRFVLGSNQLYDNLVGGVTGNVLTIVRDAWVLISVDIDLDAGTQTVRYNDQLLYTASWNRLGGVRAFAAVDLYGSSASHVYYDDIRLAPYNAGASKITSWTMAAPSP